MLRGLALILAVAGLSLATGSVDFTPQGTQPGLQVGMEGPQNCSYCHQGVNSQELEFMPLSSWSGSMMANAARDPLFWAALDVANRDVPGVGDYCLRCHTPAAWLAGRVHKDGSGGFVNGQNGCRLLGDHNDPDFTNNDYAGVTCHLCHRLMPNGPGGEPGFTGNGNLWVDDALDCDGNYGPCRRGPYRYPQVGIEPPPHGWVQSVYHLESELCGSCHDVSTPITSAGPLKTLILNDGTNSGLPYPIERTFSEWRQSDHADLIFADGFGPGEPAPPALTRGATCQECHMRSSSDPLAKACQQNLDGSRTNDLPVHEFAGANAWVPGLIKGEYGGETGLNRDAELDRTALRTREMLTTRSAALVTVLEPFVPAAQVLTARVKVSNLAGHKLPTGYGEGRRMWLQVRALDANSELVWESGAYQSATGVLTEDAQLKVYEVQQGIWSSATGQCEIADGNGRKLFHFALNDCIRLDNRIPPLGFRGGADLETRPVGYTYPETSPGSGRLVNYDTTTYSIPVPLGTALPVQVTATLRFQVSSKEYLEFLRDEAVLNAFPSENALCAGDRPPLATGPRTLSRGQYMFNLWSSPTYGKSPPVDMVTASASTSP